MFSWLYSSFYSGQKVSVNLRKTVLAGYDFILRYVSACASEKEEKMVPMAYVIL